MTGCSGRRSNCFGSSVCSTAKRVCVCSSKNIEYSRMPVSWRRVRNSGQMAVCRRRYSSSKPLCSFMVKAIRCMVSFLTNEGHGYSPVYVEHIPGGFIHQPADKDKAGVGDVLGQDHLVQQGAFGIISRQLLHGDPIGFCPAFRPGAFPD